MIQHLQLCRLYLHQYLTPKARPPRDVTPERDMERVTDAVYADPEYLNLHYVTTSSHPKSV